MEFLAAHLGGLAKFTQILATVFMFFLFLCGLNALKQSMYLFLEFGLMLTNRFAAHEGITIRVGLYLGTVHKKMLKRDVLFIGQELNNRSEYGFENIFHPLGGIDTLSVGINDNLVSILGW